MTATVSHRFDSYLQIPDVIPWRRFECPKGIEGVIYKPVHDGAVQLRQFVTQSPNAHSALTRVFAGAVDPLRTEALIDQGLTRLKEWHDRQAASQAPQSEFDEIDPCSLGIDIANPAHDDALVALAVHEGPRFSLKFLRDEDFPRKRQLAIRIGLAWLENQTENWKYLDAACVRKIASNLSIFWGDEYPAIMREVLGKWIDLLETKDRQTQLAAIETMLASFVSFEAVSGVKEDRNLRFRVADLAFRHQLTEDLSLFNKLNLDSSRPEVQALFLEALPHGAQSFLASPSSYLEFLGCDDQEMIKWTRFALANAPHAFTKDQLDHMTSRMLYWISNALIEEGTLEEVVHVLSVPEVFDSMSQDEHFSERIRKRFDLSREDLGRSVGGETGRLIVEVQILPLLKQAEETDCDTSQLAAAIETLSLWLEFQTPPSDETLSFFAAQMIHASKNDHSHKGYQGLVIRNQTLLNAVLNTLPKALPRVADPEGLLQKGREFPDTIAAALPFLEALCDGATRDRFLELATLSLRGQGESWEAWKYIAAFGAFLTKQVDGEKPEYYERAQALLRYAIESVFETQGGVDALVERARFLFQQLTLVTTVDCVLHALGDHVVTDQELEESLKEYQEELQDNRVTRVNGRVVITHEEQGRVTWHTRYREDWTPDLVVAAMRQVTEGPEWIQRLAVVSRTPEGDYRCELPLGYLVRTQAPIEDFLIEFWKTDLTDGFDSSKASFASYLSQSSKAGLDFRGEWFQGLLNSLSGKTIVHLLRQDAFIQALGSCWEKKDLPESFGELLRTKLHEEIKRIGTKLGEDADTARFLTQLKFWVEECLPAKEGSFPAESLSALAGTLILAGKKDCFASWEVERSESRLGARALMNIGALTVSLERI